MYNVYPHIPPTNNIEVLYDFAPDNINLHASITIAAVHVDEKRSVVTLWDDMVHISTKIKALSEPENAVNKQSVHVLHNVFPPYQ